MRFDPLPSSSLPPALQAMFQFWSLQPTLERWLAGQQAARSTSMALALYQREEGWLLRTPLPGVPASAIALEVDGNALTLAGEWPREELEGAESQHLERPHGRFQRTLRLPFEIDAARVQARVESGVLEVELPRLAKSAPVKIQVLSEAARN
jgi:HSP20 family protein